MSLRRAYCAWLIGQKYTYQRCMDLKMAIVINEPQLTKLIHEMAHS